MWKNPFATADRNSQQNTQQQQQPNKQQNNSQNRQNNQQQQNRQQPESGVIPDNEEDPNNQDPNNNDESHDPLHKFDDIWHPNKNEKGEAIPDDNEEDDSPFLPKIDPAKFSGMLEKMDFTKNISSEEWTAIETGGAGAGKAMQGILNKAMRHAFATNFNAMSRVVEGGFSNAKGRFGKTVPNMVRDFMTEDGMMGTEGLNEIAKSPAFAPVVQNVRKQYLKKFPKSTPSEVTAAVNGYFDNMAEKITASKTKKQQNNQQPENNKSKLRQGTGDADFEEWFGAELGLGSAAQQNNNQT